MRLLLLQRSAYVMALAGVPTGLGCGGECPRGSRILREGKVVVGAGTTNHTHDLKSAT